ncbi:sigma 54-interacting transcriptional regulator [Clostridium sp. AM58-1XD]|uniref:sigma 54-interacting transcriptional regulator n=1 Tax=Clostridium sp. AM58-1XD TaxID=2292307 RepID=UPI001FA8D964|nr:sigma 54-interacting transcriptional regulator [Clostridium sp. AM58-1XD]
MDYAMEAEKKNAAQMETLLDYASNGVMRLDGSGTAVSVNRVMEQLMGREEKELTGRLLSDIFPEITREHLSGVMAGGEENCSWFLQAGSNAVLATLAPVIVEGRAEGAIFTCHRMKKKAPDRTKNRERKAGLIALGDFRDILQLSENMQECIRKARLYSMSERPVLIMGETGTEVRLLAQGIHNSSLRSAGPFLTVNCGEMTPEEQRERIFGEKGAVSAVNGGTLFLEDGELLTSDCQYRLYQLIRYRTNVSDHFLRTGHLDIRIICSTSTRLAEKTVSKAFREDLFYLLEGLSLEVPPLRSRKEDLKQKISDCLKYACEKYSRYHTLTEGGWKYMMDYAWPGNNLQLESFVERLVLTAGKRTLDERNVSDLMDELYPEYYLPSAALGMQPPASMPQRTDGKRGEAERIAAASEKFGGNREKMAAELGISKTTLWRKMKKYGIS